MTPATAEALRVECCWCKKVMHEGTGAVSHGVCEKCQPLTREPLYPWRVRDLGVELATAYGRWDSPETEPAFRQAFNRFTRAFDAMVEDYEREIRRLKIAAAETTNAN